MREVFVQGSDVVLGPRGSTGSSDSDLAPRGCGCLVCKGPASKQGIDPLGYLEPVAITRENLDESKYPAGQYLNTCVTCKHFDRLHFECRAIPRYIVEVPVDQVEQKSPCWVPCEENYLVKVVSYLEQKICNQKMTIETYKHRDEAMRLGKVEANPVDFFKEPLVAGEFEISGFRL